MSRFRILDLGAHDGFVSLWLARQMRERGVEVEIKGLELHPGAVQIANERARKEDFDVDYRQGLAEDAAIHWDKGDFDAVIAFEVIEHVPDVDKFLNVCEFMCKRDGSIYLSTPDGCFGEGHNPHHLRVYRSIDLYNLVRRRGTVNNLHPGRDGVVVLSYTPTFLPPKPEAVVHAGAGWETWHPRDITLKGLGGSETAAAMVAEQLSELGYAVTLYGEVEEGMWNQVELRHHSTFDPMVHRELVVVSRNPGLFDRPIKATRAVLWMHDTDYGLAMTPERVQRMDGIYVLSDWHKSHVAEMYPFIPEDKLQRTINGINPDFFPAEKIPTSRPRRAIFSSSPDRGLDLVLELWPQVREEVPDAELVYCYSDVYNRVADVDPTIARFRDKCRGLADQEGVVNLGSLPQDKLAAAMAMCRVWLAPSYNTVHDIPFNETFCIGAVEAAAAGCHRITADWGALAERTAGDYSMIPYLPSPDDDLHTDAWVDQIVKYLTREETEYHQFPDALEYSWAQTARDLAGV